MPEAPTPSPAPEHSAPDGRLVVLALLCAATFTAASANSVVGTLIPSFADDYGVSRSLAGQTVTVFALTAGAVGLFVGALLGRTGQRALAIAGLVVLALAGIASAAAPSFWAFVLSRACAGVGSAFLMPAVMAAVTSVFPFAERGRAMSWLLSSQVGAMVVGVPLGAAVGGAVSWRWTLAAYSLATLAAAVVLWRRLPLERAANAQAESLRAVISTFRDASTAGVQLSNFVANFGWAVFGTFFAAFLKDEFQVPTTALGLGSMAIGGGVVLGTVAGGRLSGRYSPKPLAIWAGAASGPFFAFAAVLATNGLMALGFVFVFGFIAGIRNCVLQSVATEVNPAARATVMSLFVAGIQFGTVGGGVLGGVLLAAVGYSGLAVIGGVLYSAAAIPVWLMLDERRIAIRAAAEPAPASPPRSEPAPAAS